MITLLHPSRGRAVKAKEAYNEWTRMAGVEVQYIISVDESDPSKDDYYNLFSKDQGINDTIIFNNNTSVVEATNRAAKIAWGDILVYLSDDFKCPDNWGQLIIKEFENENRPLLLKVDDCLQPFHVPVLTIPIMNRALYKRLGYFFHPGYKSMFCDCDLFETVKRIGSIKDAKHLKFPHEHVSIGKAQDDETYRNSAKNWDQGKAFFAQRKAMGFPL